MPYPRDPEYLRPGAMLQRYVDRFMKGPEGGFFTTQSRPECPRSYRPFTKRTPTIITRRERSAYPRGLQWIDKHEYWPCANGLAIAAYCTMFEITKDAIDLYASADGRRRAAQYSILASPLPSGGITHDRIGESAPKILLLSSDNTRLRVSAFVRLYGDEERRLAEIIARADGRLRAMKADLVDEAGDFSIAERIGCCVAFRRRRTVSRSKTYQWRHLNFCAAQCRHSPPSRPRAYRAMIDRTLCLLISTL